jgi:hypothetical protein
VYVRKALNEFAERLKALAIFIVLLVRPLVMRLRRGNGDPGGNRLRSLAESSLICSALPESYKVLSLQSTPTRWETSGYAIFGGRPAWTRIRVQEDFWSSDAEASVHQLWADRAAADRWVVDPGPVPPAQWAWKKQFKGYEALFELTSMSSGMYQVVLDAPPRGAKT